MCLVRQRVAVIEEVPVGLTDVPATQCFEAHPGIRDTAALLLDLLSLLALQAGKEISEIGIRLRITVGPVKLHRGAHHPACFTGGGAVRFVDEQQVCR